MLGARLEGRARLLPPRSWAEGALAPPTELPNDFGRFAVLADPDGNPVGLWVTVSEDDGGSGAGLAPGPERASTEALRVLAEPRAIPRLVAGGHRRG